MSAETWCPRCGSPLTDPNFCPTCDSEHEEYLLAIRLNRPLPRLRSDGTDQVDLTPYHRKRSALRTKTVVVLAWIATIAIETIALVIVSQNPYVFSQDGYTSNLELYYGVTIAIIGGAFLGPLSLYTPLMDGAKVGSHK